MQGTANVHVMYMCSASHLCRLSLLTLPGNKSASVAVIIMAGEPDSDPINTSSVAE
jgi:hypothetical protein